jgi:cell division septation protein DedD
MTRPPRRGALNIPATAHPAPEAEAAATGLAEIVAQTLDTVPAPEQTAEQPQQQSSLFRLRKRYIQVATFAEEANANATVEALAAAGVQALTQANDPDTPTLWRVVTGPYEKRATRSAQLRIIRGLGYTDAFFFK